MIIGCIGDDFTGSSDLANTLAKGGMRTVQFNGIPDAPAEADIEAGVVALKTRTAPVEQAVAESLAALRWLMAQGCRQYLFKYCSTFDSTPEGNIGPVLDALARELKASRAIVCPAFPATGRTVYNGHLFVNDRLLNESGMESHPLTPMTDPDIRRWLGLQTKEPVGHVLYREIAKGARAIEAALDEQAQKGARYIVLDAVSDEDLEAIGRAMARELLLSGGSGIALGLPKNFAREGAEAVPEQSWAGRKGPVVALCGSCSVNSRRQVAYHAERHPARSVAADDVMAGLDADALADWAVAQAAEGRVPLIYSSADPEVIRRAQDSHGKARVAESIENLFARVSQRLRDRGVEKIVTAGGETSGAVVSVLGAKAFHIGPEIDPGVPAVSVVGENLVLALKSGNFGGLNFFEKAALVLGGTMAEKEHAE
ncbi:3-oxo-tetronate kinase [Telmatospirillum sp. J64-1]|uniref:3-oxo-tetronate kinase n=1 Tax=Telmatospirillum sp. J64-1 TaxID=2502183 RepID=UPI00115DCE4F|nr:3-oxo-tetronate kinase [Telmatospirillum sp. J64-1]